MIRRFVVMAFGVTWLAVSPLVLAALLGGFHPPEWLHGVGALGPVLAAWILLRSEGKASGFAALYASGHDGAMTPFWTGVSIATPALFAGLALVVATVQEAAPLAPLVAALRNPQWLFTLFLSSVLYGLGEEPGWRGWLLPRLQERQSAVRATLILAPIWAVWHAPFFFYRFHFEGLTTVIGFFIGLLAGAFWLTFLYNSTGGNVRALALWHILWNVANLSLAEVSSLAVGVLNALMMVLGFAVLLAFGRRELRLGEHAGPRAS
jgi:membrane protease YdiL (CAAX protease family)